MDSLAISHIRSSSPKYAEVWALREEVLRMPLGMSLKNEDLSRDHVDDIFMAEISGHVVACLLLHKIDDETIQLRAMAVSNHWQGKGIGRLLVQAAEEFCWHNGFVVITLHARKVAVGFYLALGYSISGNEFIEVGIPHFIMQKQKPVL